MSWCNLCSPSIYTLPDTQAAVGALQAKCEPHCLMRPLHTVLTQVPRPYLSSCNREVASNPWPLEHASESDTPEREDWCLFPRF